MCLSPMPWMLCSPNPFSSIVGHSSASTATIFVPYSSFRRSPAAIVPADPVADVNAASRRSRPDASRTTSKTWPSARPVTVVVAEMVAELAELVEHEVLGILGQLVARVVDLLHVRLGAVGADHVVGRVLAPLVEPVEPLLAHPLGEDRHTAARHDAADRDATTGVVAGRRPDRAVAGRVELTGHDPRREAGVGGEHLVGGDHREAVAEDDDDRAVDAGQARGAARRGRARRPGCRRGRCTSGPATGCGRRDPAGRHRRRLASWSNVDGSASSANVGSVIPRSRNRSTLSASASSSTTRSASPNWFSSACVWESDSVTVDSLSKPRRDPTGASAHEVWRRERARADVGVEPRAQLDRRPPPVADLGGGLLWCGSRPALRTP